MRKVREGAHMRRENACTREKKVRKGREMEGRFDEINEFLHFFSKIFGQFKKKQYLCTLFRRKCLDTVRYKANETPL